MVKQRNKFCEVEIGYTELLGNAQTSIIQKTYLNGIFVLTASFQLRSLFSVVILFNISRNDAFLGSGITLSSVL